MAEGSIRISLPDSSGLFYIWVITTTGHGLIDYHLHYPYLLEDMESWLCITVFCRKRQTEPVVVVPFRRLVPVPVRRLQVPRIVVPTTAAKHLAPIPFTVPS